MSLNMVTNKNSKLKKIKEQVVIAKKKVDIPGKREFGADDILKHFIRKYFWKRRIIALRRDLAPNLRDGIRYFSLCSKLAFDVRLFLNENLINLESSRTAFVFCESEKKDFNFLNNNFIHNRLHGNGLGFEGLLSEIALETKNDYDGYFWGSFPFDVINLDYLGDIFKANIHKIGVNDFYTIKTIIEQQSRLRRPYELWITMRTKPGRLNSSIKQNFKEFIDLNLEQYKDTFKKKFNELYPNVKKSSGIPDEHLFFIAYLKWLWYVCKTSFSTINSSHLQVLKYSRIDKDNKKYNLYNILLRIEPYESVIIPSPAGEPATFCEEEYEKGILTCFNPPIDINKEYDALSDTKIKDLKKELEKLNNEFIDDCRGYLP